MEDEGTEMIAQTHDKMAPLSISLGLFLTITAAHVQGRALIIFDCVIVEIIPTRNE